MLGYAIVFIAGILIGRNLGCIGTFERSLRDQRHG
jgi:hypothetical protein